MCISVLVQKLTGSSYGEMCGLLAGAVSCAPLPSGLISAHLFQRITTSSHFLKWACLLFLDREGNLLPQNPCSLWVREMVVQRLVISPLITFGRGMRQVNFLASCPIQGPRWCWRNGISRVTIREYVLPALVAMGRGKSVQSRKSVVSLALRRPRQLFFSFQTLQVDMGGRFTEWNKDSLCFLSSLDWQPGRGEIPAHEISWNKKTKAMGKWGRWRKEWWSRMQAYYISYSSIYSKC